MQQLHTLHCCATLIIDYTHDSDACTGEASADMHSVNFTGMMGAVATVGLVSSSLVGIARDPASKLVLDGSSGSNASSDQPLKLQWDPDLQHALCGTMHLRPVAQ